MAVSNFLCVWFQVGSEAIICANIPVQMQTNDLLLDMIIACLYFIPFFLHIIVAIYFDQKLKKIFKARNDIENQPNHLVPWHAVGANLEDQNIPQKATNISICSPRP